MHRSGLRRLRPGPEWVPGNCRRANDPLPLGRNDQRRSPGCTRSAGGTQVDFELTVNSDGDGGDTNPGNGICADAGGNCTLRAAIEESNARAGREIINFDIRGQGGSCPAMVTIAAATTLEIDDAFKANVGGNYGVTIDGYSQCDASANTGPVVGNAVIKIQIQGPKMGGVDGIYLNSGNNTIKGLALYDWSNQIIISDGWANNNFIQGNFIGTKADSTYVTRFGAQDNADGVRIDFNGGTGNIIGARIRPTGISSPALPRTASACARKCASQHDHRQLYRPSPKRIVFDP